MKRFFKTFRNIFLLAVIIIPTTIFAIEKRGIEINVNSKKIPLNEEIGVPYIDPQNDRLFVPIRVVSENLGYKVDWDQQNKKVTVSGNKKLELTVGKTTAKPNGKNVRIDSTGKVATALNGNRTYVPLRFVSEQMGAKVDYKMTDKLHVINITKDGVQVAVKEAPEGILRPGETLDDVLKRAKAKYTETNAPGKVSDKWIDPDIRTVYIDPFSNKFGLQLPFGFGLMNSRKFEGKDPNKYWVKFEIDDDRYLPYEEHFEIATGENTWGPMNQTEINAVTKKYPLDSKGATLAPFAFYDYSKISGTLLRTKGYDRVVAPYTGDVIDYKVTIHQDGEEHEYKFKVQYGMVLTDYTLNKHVPKDQKERQLEVFKGMDLYRSKSNSYLRSLPLNWTQVR